MNLKEIRKEKGMTQEELANAIGMSSQAVHYYENGTREPNLKTLQKLSDTLGCTVDDLIREPEAEDENCNAG